MKLIKICVAVAFVIFASAETQSDNFQLTDYVEIKRNDYQNNEAEERSDDSIENKVEELLKSHDVNFKLPIVGSTLTFTARNLDQDEVDIKLRFDNGNEVAARKHKLKLKKVFVPIFVFILIKAMILIPLALGILAIKTWNALQLSFVSFVIALALGVWQLCKKVSGDNAHPHIIAHNPWDAAARSFDMEEAQKLAYSAYALKQ